MSAARRALLVAVACYAAVVALFAALETTLLFPAPRLSQAWLRTAAERVGARELALRSEDGTALYGWRIGDGSPLVVFFDGNGSTVGAATDLYALLVAQGAAVLHVNYRGYPGSEGSPSEAGLRMDARAAWAEARRTHDAEDIVVLGHSLGGGVAVGLAAERCAAGEPPRALALSATFTSAARVAREAYPWLPVDAIMRNRFDSLALAPAITCPSLVVHGEADTLIRPRHGRELAAAIEGARLLTVPGVGHNDPLWTRPGPAAALTALLAGEAP